MQDMEFKTQLEQETARCEKIVRSFLPKEEGYAKTVIEAANYSVLAGGKRLRPMLIDETGKMYEGREDLRTPFMAAIEMIHTYSLIHDDLPAMDNDTLRRGRKTTWAVYGDGMAVIAGDGLLNYAFETALLSFDRTENANETQRVIHAMKILAKNAGFSGMVGGQCADIESEKDSSSLNDDKLRYIHLNKTAAMIRSGFTIGAVLAGAPEKDVESLAGIADRVGLAFQIQDDILDVVGDRAELGKSIGKDKEEGKVTYVTLHSLDGAKKEVEHLTQEALTGMDALSRKNSFLRMLVMSMMTRTR